MSIWTGRSDGPRWHHIVTDSGDSTVGIVGFASDEGVRRNHGRPGASEGPTALRQALAPLAVHGQLSVVDHGDVTVGGTDLEQGHHELAAAVAASVSSHPVTFVLGGGHETAYGSHCGLRHGLNDDAARDSRTNESSRSPRVGVINLDAHFDLRRAEEATSGTPFLQICEQFDCGPDYLVVGVSRPNNTQELFDEADRLGATYVEDWQIDQADSVVANFLESHDVIHLSIDLDVLPAGVAPGVSAPAGLGVDLATIRALACQVAASGKLRLVDVVELNPGFDVDGRTAKVAARLLWDIATIVAGEALHNPSCAG